MIKHLLETIEVETVGDVVLVDFAEELVVFDGAEPVDPPLAFIGAVAITIRHPSILYYSNPSNYTPHILPYSHLSYIVLSTYIIIYSCHPCTRQTASRSHPSPAPSSTTSNGDWKRRDCCWTPTSTISSSTGRKNITRKTSTASSASTTRTWSWPRLTLSSQNWTKATMATSSMSSWYQPMTKFRKTTTLPRS